MPCVMSAANEIAVAAFLADRCKITDIDAIVEKTMEAHRWEPSESIAQLEEADAWARQTAAEVLKTMTA